MVSNPNREAFIKHELEHGRTEDQGIARLINFVAVISRDPFLIRIVESMIDEHLQK